MKFFVLCFAVANVDALDSTGDCDILFGDDEREYIPEGGSSGNGSLWTWTSSIKLDYSGSDANPTYDDNSSYPDTMEFDNVVCAYSEDEPPVFTMSGIYTYGGDKTTGTASCDRTKYIFTFDEAGTATTALQTQCMMGGNISPGNDEGAVVNPTDQIFTSGDAGDDDDDDDEEEATYDSDPNMAGEEDYCNIDNEDEGCDSSLDLACTQFEITDEAYEAIGDEWQATNDAYTDDNAEEYAGMVEDHFEETYAGGAGKCIKREGCDVEDTTEIGSGFTLTYTPICNATKFAATFAAVLSTLYIM